MTFYSYVIGVILVVFGILLLLFAINSWRFKVKSLSFPKVVGKVTRSEVIDLHEGSPTIGDVRIISPSSRRPSRPFSPQLEIEYFVNGERYTVGKEHLDLPNCITRDSAAEKLSFFPQGREVDVYFNPGKPSEALLFPEKPNKMDTFFLILLGLGIICVGLNAISYARSHAG